MQTLRVHLAVWSDQDPNASELNPFMTGSRCPKKGSKLLYESRSLQRRNLTWSRGIEAPLSSRSGRGAHHGARSISMGGGGAQPQAKAQALGMYVREVLHPNQMLLLCCHPPITTLGSLIPQLTCPHVEVTLNL